MRCASRPSRAGDTGAGRRLARAFAIGFALTVAAVSSAHAQIFPNPQPTPTPGITIISSEISANNTVSNLGSSFLERLGNQATNGANRIGRTNPGGGGASEAAEAPKFRAWGEAYGLDRSTRAVTSSPETPPTSGGSSITRCVRTIRYPDSDSRTRSWSKSGGSWR